MAEGFPSVSAYRPASQPLSNSGGDDHASLQAGKLLLAQGNRNAFGRVEIDPRTGLHTQLQALPNGSGKVSVEVNATIVTTEIKARLQFHDGQWRLAGYVADGVSEYVKRPISLNQKPEAEGYLSRSIGRQTLITDKRGKGITDPALARERVAEMLIHGGLTTKTHELAQQQRRSRVENSTPVVTGTTVKAYVPRVALPKPIAQMTMTDRLAYMRDVAWSTAGKNGLEELKSLTSPQSLFFMAAFAGAQTTPITSLMANGLATLMLGKDVIDTGGKLASSLQAGLTAKNGHELETAGLQMGEAAVHIGARLATGAVGKQVARVAKNYRETASTRVLERTLVDYKAGKASAQQLRAAVIAASQDQGVSIPIPLVPKTGHTGEYERATGAVKPSTTPATPTPKPAPPAVITMEPDGKNGYRAKPPAPVKDVGRKALPPSTASGQAAKPVTPEALVATTHTQLAKGDLAGAASSIEALKTAEQLAREAGNSARADAIGLASHNLEANRKALAREVNAPQNSAVPAEPVWSDQRVANAVDKLARKQGISAPAQIELMKSLALNPSMTNAQRASSLNRSLGSVENWTNKLREQLGAGSTPTRIALAEHIGMPFSAMAARIRVDGDPGLTQRVLNKINPDHREGVARKLLTVQSGTDLDVNVYRALNTIFFGGNFLAGRDTLAEQLAISQTKATAVSHFLDRIFPGDRIDKLRAMGFTHEQVLVMNPVGAQLSKRFDPALGTYSTAERALRQSKNLPCTREEAAQRLLGAGVRKESGHVNLSFRNLLALGLVSDRPWLTASQVAEAYTDAAPDTNWSGGNSDISRVFREAQALLGRDIPRGIRNDLMDSRYRAEINLVLLQTFGLGATRVGSGVLEPIPTNHDVGNWPSPSTEPADRERRNSPKNAGAPEATWQELMPLLERHEVRR